MEKDIAFRFLRFWTYAITYNVLKTKIGHQVDDEVKAELKAQLMLMMSAAADYGFV
jgi:hypothetical protein